MTESEKTLALREIVPSSPWHRSERGEDDIKWRKKMPAARVKSRRKTIAIVGLDSAGNEVMGSFTKVNRSQTLNITRTIKQYKRNAWRARQRAKKDE